MIIGAHLSASKGYRHMLDEALSIGANTFQFFTRNPRGGKAKDIDENDIKSFHEGVRSIISEQFLLTLLTLLIAARQMRQQEFLPRKPLPMICSEWKQHRICFIISTRALMSVRARISE